MKNQDGFDTYIYNGMPYAIREGHAFEDLGYLPDFVTENDPRTAVEQFNERYAHGGGWRPIKGFEINDVGDLNFPGDPIYKSFAVTVLRDSIILFYECGITAVVTINSDGRKLEVARMD